MSDEAKATAPTAPAYETIEPLSEMEASLVATVGEWRDEKTRELQLAYEKLLSEANQRIAPVLRAHGLRPGDTWDIRQDKASSTGWALALTRNPDNTDTPTTQPRVGRTELRRAVKALRKKAHR